MIIGIDGGSLSIRDDRLRVGVYRVTKNLLIHLLQIDTQSIYRLYSFRKINEEEVASHKRLVKRSLEPSLGYQYVRLPFDIMLNPVDVFLGTSQMLPRLHSNILSIG